MQAQAQLAATNVQLAEGLTLPYPKRAPRVSPRCVRAWQLLKRQLVRLERTEGGGYPPKLKTLQLITSSPRTIPRSQFRSLCYACHQLVRTEDRVGGVAHVASDLDPHLPPLLGRGRGAGEETAARAWFDVGFR